MYINKLLYLLLFFGLLLWQDSFFYMLYISVRTRIFIGRNLRKYTDSEELHPHGKLGKHLHLLIEGADMKSFFPEVRTFYVLCAVIFCGTVMLLHFILSKEFSLLCGMFMALLPYLFLQARLHERRVARSKEGDLLVQELLNNYQIYTFNMREAIEKTASALDDAPMGKRLMTQLAKDLQNAVTKKEVEERLSMFRYALGTAWGNILASNILFGYLYGIRVDEALKDLLFCMTQSRQVVEYGKRENHEARLMLIYLTPISFLFSIFIACHYFGFTVKKFMMYQFGTTLGLQWFMLMIICYTLSILIQKFFAKEKMDI